MTSASTQIGIEYVAVGDLRPWTGNPRKIDEDELQRLRRSIRDFGLIDPVIVRRSDAMVIGGHQRLVAAQAEGITEAPVVFVEFDDTKAAALNVALNKIGGDWDWPKLADLFQELDVGDFDVTMTGFDEREIEGLMHGLDEVATKEYDESVANDVKKVTCPECKHEFAYGTKNPADTQSAAASPVSSGYGQNDTAGQVPELRTQ